jgi:type III secretion protein F
MNMNINDVFSRMGQATKAAETELNEQINLVKQGNSSNPADLMALQQKMQQWTMATNLQSNTLKTLGEAMKSVAQNIR